MQCLSILVYLARVRSTNRTVHYQQRVPNCRPAEAMAGNPARILVTSQAAQLMRGKVLWLCKRYYSRVYTKSWNENTKTPHKLHCMMMKTTMVVMMNKQPPITVLEIIALLKIHIGYAIICHIYNHLANICEQLIAIALSLYHSLLKTAVKN